MEITSSQARTDRVSAARAARRLYADRRMAERLRDRGWTCLEPGSVVSADRAADAVGVLHIRVHAVDVAGTMPLPGQLSLVGADAERRP